MDPLTLVGLVAGMFAAAANLLVAYRTRRDPGRAMMRILIALIALYAVIVSARVFEAGCDPRAIDDMLHPAVVCLLVVVGATALFDWNRT